MTTDHCKMTIDHGKMTIDHGKMTTADWPVADMEVHLPERWPVGFQWERWPLRVFFYFLRSNLRHIWSHAAEGQASGFPNPPPDKDNLPGFYHNNPPQFNRR